MATKTIQEQIAAMESRCNQLEELQKLFEKAVKNEFGIDAKKIHKIIENGNNISLDFANKITTYFNLKTKEDLTDFLTIFCTERNLNYFIKNHTKEKEVPSIPMTNNKLPAGSELLL